MLKLTKKGKAAVAETLVRQAQESAEQVEKWEALEKNLTAGEPQSSTPWSS